MVIFMSVRGPKIPDFFGLKQKKNTKDRLNNNDRLLFLFHWQFEFLNLYYMVE